MKQQKKSVLKNNGLWNVKKTEMGEVWLLKERVWEKLISLQLGTKGKSKDEIVAYYQTYWFKRLWRLANKKA